MIERERIQQEARDMTNTNHNIFPIEEKHIRLLQELSEARSPSGFEDESVRAARHYAAPFCRIEEDHLRNLYLYPGNFKGNKPIFLLDAHSDEVGFMVHSIHPTGCLRFVQLGSWSLSTLPGMPVRVRNKEGNWIPGVIAARPPHFMSKEERNHPLVQEISQLVIDIGARSAEEAEQRSGIRIGEPAVADVSFLYEPSSGLFRGKAFDCRIGCAALLISLEQLAQEENLPFDVVGLLSSQEEVGERGIKVAINRIDPDVAICFEGCPADDTFGETYAMQTRLGSGPMLRFMDQSVICNPRFQRWALDQAEAEQIPAQASVREGGGNNAAVVQAQLRGAPAIVMGVPVRYIHGPQGLSVEEDLAATIQLACQLTRTLKPELLATF